MLGRAWVDGQAHVKQAFCARQDCNRVLVPCHRIPSYSARPESWSAKPNSCCAKPRLALAKRAVALPRNWWKSWQPSPRAQETRPGLEPVASRPGKFRPKACDLECVSSKPSPNIFQKTPKSNWTQRILAGHDRQSSQTRARFDSSSRLAVAILAQAKPGMT